MRMTWMRKGFLIVGTLEAIVAKASTNLFFAHGTCSYLRLVKDCYNFCLKVKFGVRCSSWTTKVPWAWPRIRPESPMILIAVRPLLLL